MAVPAAVVPQQLSSPHPQGYSAQMQPRGRIVLTPQRPGFQICGSLPSAVDFYGYDVQDVARIEQSTLTQSFTPLPPFLPCPGTKLQTA